MVIVVSLWTAAQLFPLIFSLPSLSTSWEVRIFSILPPLSPFVTSLSSLSSDIGVWPCLSPLLPERLQWGQHFKKEIQSRLFLLCLSPPHYCFTTHYLCIKKKTPFFYSSCISSAPFCHHLSLSSSASSPYKSLRRSCYWSWHGHAWLLTLY